MSSSFNQENLPDLPFTPIVRKGRPVSKQTPRDIPFKQPRSSTPMSRIPRRRVTAENKKSVAAAQKRIKTNGLTAAVVPNLSVNRAKDKKLEKSSKVKSVVQSKLFNNENAKNAVVGLKLRSEKRDVDLKRVIDVKQGISSGKDRLTLMTPPPPLNKRVVDDGRGKASVAAMKKKKSAIPRLQSLKSRSTVAIATESAGSNCRAVISENIFGSLSSRASSDKSLGSRANINSRSSKKNVISNVEINDRRRVLEIVRGRNEENVNFEATNIDCTVSSSRVNGAISSRSLISGENREQLTKNKRTVARAKNSTRDSRSAKIHVSSSGSEMVIDKKRRSNSCDESRPTSSVEPESDDRRIYDFNKNGKKRKRNERSKLSNAKNIKKKSLEENEDSTNEQRRFIKGQLGRRSLEGHARKVTPVAKQKTLKKARTVKKQKPEKGSIYELKIKPRVYKQWKIVSKKSVDFVMEMLSQSFNRKLMRCHGMNTVALVRQFGLLQETVLQDLTHIKVPMHKEKVNYSALQTQEAFLQKCLDENLTGLERIKEAIDKTKKSNEEIKYLTEQLESEEPHLISDIERHLVTSEIEISKSEESDK